MWCNSLRFVTLGEARLIRWARANSEGLLGTFGWGTSENGLQLQTSEELQTHPRGYGWNIVRAHICTVRLALMHMHIQTIAVLLQHFKKIHAKNILILSGILYKWIHVYIPGVIYADINGKVCICINTESNQTCKSWKLILYWPGPRLTKRATSTFHKPGQGGNWAIVSRKIRGRKYAGRQRDNYFKG